MFPYMYMSYSPIYIYIPIYMSYSPIIYIFPNVSCGPTIHIFPYIYISYSPAIYIYIYQQNDKPID